MGERLFNGNGHERHNSEPRKDRMSSFNGIKFFEGKPIPSDEEIQFQLSLITVDQLREQYKVWRPEETIEAAQIFFRDKRINVIGPPQSGKGTILFGLSEICSELEIGYVFIDGHHQEVPGEIVAETIKEAGSRQIPIFYDSTDYAFLRSRARGRDVSATTQIARVPPIMDALHSSTVPTALTMHDREWVETFLNLDLLQQNSAALGTYTKYEIPLHLTPLSAKRFLLDHNIPENEACIITELSENDQLQEQIRAVLTEKESLATILGALSTYPVLKELAREQHELFQPLLRGLIAKDPQATREFATIVLEAEETRINLTSIRKDRKSGDN